MAKLKTTSQLQDYLDEEMAWRLKEIADYNSALRKAGKLEKQVLARAAIPFLYAHWEGFVKNAADAYVKFVNNQTVTFDQLITCFVVLGVKKHIHTLKETKKTKLNIEALDFIRNHMAESINIGLDGAINTESNLKSHVFENIALTIGIDPAEYESKYNLIDQSLVNRRNEIAHGKYLIIEPEDFKNLSTEVLALLRKFKTDIQNAVSLSSYMKAI